jgi:hypothetical protein
MRSRSRKPVIALLILMLASRAPALAEEGNDAETKGIRVFDPSYYVEFDPVSALEMVFRTPGFNPQESDGGRGLSGVRSNILINGERPPPKGKSIRQLLRETPVAGVSRIELIDAGSRLDIDMQGYPQVVNVVTVADAPAYYEVTTQVQHTGTGDVQQENSSNAQVQATGSFSWKKHEFTLSGNYNELDNRSPADFVAIDPANPEQRLSSLSHFARDNSGIDLNAVFRLPGQSSLTFTGQLSDDSRGSSPISLVAQDDTLDSIAQSFDNDQSRRDFSAEYRRPLAARGELTAAFVDGTSTQQSNSSLSSTDSIRSSLNDTESGETAARVLVTSRPSDSLTIRTTASTAFNYFEGQFHLFENGIELPVAGSDSRVTEDRRSIDSTVDWNLSDRWTFSGSVGLESYQIESRDVDSGLKTDPKGNVKISFRPQPRTTLSFESTREIGQLSFGQFLASSNLSSEILTAGAAELEPVRRWIHSLSYDRRFGDVGVLRFELSRQQRDNPIQSVALSDSLIVSQNTSPQHIDRLETSIELPFSKFGRDDLILGIEGAVTRSDSIDPVTGEAREVSGNPFRYWSVELRRDPRAGDLAWGMSVGRQSRGIDYSVRNISDSSSSHQWSAYVEWEPIDGLKFRTNLNGPSTETSMLSLYPAVRAIGLDPSYIASTTFRTDRSASFQVEWRRRDHLEVRANFSTRPSTRTEESLTPFGEAAGPLLATGIDSAPRLMLRVRVFR